MGVRVLPADLRKPLERALGNALPPALACASAMMVASAVLDALLLSASIRAGIVALDLGTAASCAAARAALGRWPRARRLSDLVAVTLGGLLAVNAIETLRQTHDLAYTAHLVLLVVSAGSVIESAAWLLGFILVVLGGWLVVGLASAPSLSLLAPAFSLLAAAGAGAGFHWARVRTFAKIGLLRARDRIRGERLRKAFSDARHELEQRKSAEVEGKRLREQLLHAQKMDAVGRLAGGVAHDMNNVLTSITTVGELLLEDGRLDSVGRDDVETILTAARRGAALTRNLLAFSRKGKNVAELLDARAIIDGARHLLGQALPPGIELEIDLRDGGARIEGDPSQLAQAVANLCVNAAEAMPDGGPIRIRTSRVTLEGLEAERRAVDAGDYMVIAVQDSGSGMDSETRRLAFDPFFTTKPQAAPTSGLGLPMVYGTARNHGGSAEVESRKNEGTTVTLHLPCARPKAKTDSVAPPSGPRVDLANRTVLLVDDEPSLRAVARRILERSGLRVRPAENGRQALDAWTAEGPFDLVVVDMAMPVMGGKELLLRLRRLAPTARVLVVSGFTGDGEAAEVMAAGALGFVEKPYTPSSLARAVRAALTGDITPSAGKVGS